MKSKFDMITKKVEFFMVCCVQKGCFLIIQNMEKKIKKCNYHHVLNLRCGENDMIMTKKKFAEKECSLLNSVFAHIWCLIGFATEPWLCILVDASDLTTRTMGVSCLLQEKALRTCFCMYVCVCSSSIYCRAPSIPEAHDLSRSSSNASSFASVVEENETEATEDYDTGMVRTAHLSSTHSSNEHL